MTLFEEGRILYSSNPLKTNSHWSRVRRGLRAPLSSINADMKIRGLFVLAVASYVWLALEMNWDRGNLNNVTAKPNGFPENSQNIMFWHLYIYGGKPCSVMGFCLFRDILMIMSLFYVQSYEIYYGITSICLACLYLFLSLSFCFMPFPLTLSPFKFQPLNQLTTSLWIHLTQDGQVLSI